jgi:membrane fusion protein, multidrug efflux system
MAFRGFAWMVVGVCGTLAAYGVYAPSETEQWVPSAGKLAHQLHDNIWTNSSGSASARWQPSNTAPPIRVSVTPVKRGDFPIVLEGLGNVQAYNMITVRARVDGQIVKIAFTEGHMVREGDLLAQIDLRPFQATLDQANAKKSQDEANLANAKLDQARYSTLAKQNVATQQQLDTQNALVNQLIGSIAGDVAAIDAAKVQKEYSTIRAPISGRAGFRLIDEGNLVSATQRTPIVTIAQLQPISVIFTAPQEYVGQINSDITNGPLQVTVSNADGAKLATGRLTVSDNQVDVATGTIKLKAEFENTDGALWPGLAVTTGMRLGVDKNVLVVPVEAVQGGEKGQYVYIVDDQNRAVAKPVKVARQDETTAVIAEGLNEGDRVVHIGQFLLQPGVPVSIDLERGS